TSLFKGIGGEELPKNILNNLTAFRTKQKQGTIDVWWLYDDGGLTLLLPYILTTRSQWAGCKLRVFALANRKDELELETRSMANLLSKFRIDFSDMIIIPDMAKKACETTRLQFDSLLEPFMSLESKEDQRDKGNLRLS
ncbi:UNVERIFIED_CONTAM: hypothetical protein GTU68_032430, partial [Idotea baltica]|nr:hypothetical protein [Idotea baltica]